VTDATDTLKASAPTAAETMALATDPAPDPADTVAVAYVHSDDVRYSWHHSMTQLMAYDLANAGRIWTGGYVAVRCGTDGLAEARNTAVEEFLADSRAGWMWWVDTDMGFAPDTVDRLLAAADPAERPIVGGLCFSQIERQPDGFGGWTCVATPTVMDWRHLGQQTGYAVRWDYPRDTVTRCDGTGSACILIHRGVFEKIHAEFGPNWYTRTRNPSTGKMISEDLSFCIRAGALSLPVYVHTGVQTTHVKRVWLGQDQYWQQRAIHPPPPKLDDEAQQLFEDGLLAPAYFEAATNG
jgi:hypothetical protein